MRILADENLYEPIIDYLRDSGHEVTSIRQEGLSGFSDNEIYGLACKEKYIIVTMDKDFSRVFRFPPMHCGGIIVVKVYRRSVEETLRIFRSFFESLKEEHLSGRTAIITPEGVRIKKARM